MTAMRSPYNSIFLLSILIQHLVSLSLNRDDYSKIPKNKLLQAYSSLQRSGLKPKKLIETVNPTSLDIAEPPVPSSTTKPNKQLNEPARNEEGVPTTAVKAVRQIYSGGSGKKKILNQGKVRVKELINPNRLRIIAGSAKGKKIDSPDVYLRPMMAKVREALFSTLEFMGLFESNTTRVMDTFCGSGSVGLESISRGAAFCCFVDLSPDCTATAMRNLDTCGFAGQGAAVCCRTEEALREPQKYGINEPFQLISITPPYEEVIYSELIEAVCNSPAVAPDTIVVIEYPEEMGKLPFILGTDKLYGVRNRKYGRTVLGIYVYRPNKKYDMRPDEFAM